MENVAPTGGLIKGIDLAASQRLDLFQDLVDSDPVPAGNIEHFTCGAIRLPSVQIGVDNIGHERKVPGLETIPVDDRPITGQYRGNEPRKYSAVGRTGILARTKDVEIT